MARSTPEQLSTTVNADRYCEPIVSCADGRPGTLSGSDAVGVRSRQRCFLVLGTTLDHIIMLSQHWPRYPPRYILVQL